MRSATAFTIATLVSLTAAAASGGQPLTLSHQGYLLGGADTPADGLHSVTFRIFAGSEPTVGETPEWEATCPVAVARGYYTALLGTSPCAGVAVGTPPDATLDSSDLPPGAARFLELTVGSLTLAPRVRITATPTAQHAEVASAVPTAQPSDCGAGAGAGRLWFNPAIGALVVCNGSQWVTVGPVPGSSAASAGRTCKDLLAKGTQADGLYWIDPDGAATAIPPFQAWCNMTQNGGGWTLFYRNKASVSGCDMCTAGAFASLVSPSQTSQGKLSDAVVHAIANGSTSAEYWGEVGTRQVFMTGALWWSTDQAGRSVKYKATYGASYSAYVSVDTRPMGTYPNYQWIPTYCSSGCAGANSGGYDGTWNRDVWVYVREP